jgi:hypothetical protein
MSDATRTPAAGGGVDPLESYLRALRSGLRGLPAGEIEEIVSELRSHVIESLGHEKNAGPTVETILRDLGSPADLSALYVTDRTLDRAENTGAPWHLLSALFRWAGRSMSGFLLLLLLVAGYFIAVSFLLAAVLKPFRPDRVGLWRLEEGEISLRLGFGGAVQGQELLGWWVVPIGIAAGMLGYLGATYFVRRGLRHRRRLSLQHRR